jgi:HTH-type transcriptional regulator / antitoxin HipB
MDDQRVGTVLRQVRLRRGLRQADVARIAGVSRTTISRIERGHFGEASLSTLRRVAAVLDVRLDLIPRWRAGDLDRLLNARHSRLHELVARRFGEVGAWLRAPEASFALGGERGVIDLLANHPASDLLLVVELKTEITDVNELLGTLDRKRRLAPRVAASLGWRPGAATKVCVWLIVSDGKTNRRRVEAHRAMLRAALPVDGRTMGGWLARPRRPVRALSFWTDDHPGNVRGGITAPRRTRRSRSCVTTAPRGRQPAESGFGRPRTFPG